VRVAILYRVGLCRVFKEKGVSLHSCRHFGASEALVRRSDLRTVAGAQEHAIDGIGDAITEAQARRAIAKNGSA
jgi:hypothetical protein